MPDPTTLPTARELAITSHSILVDNGVLNPGDCSDPSNLLTLAESVFNRTGQQAPLVDAMGRTRLENAEPNDGYLIAAVLMRERAISCVLTLNFDHAASSAVVMIGAKHEISVIRGPEDYARLTLLNVIVLHRSADSAGN